MEQENYDNKENGGKNTSYSSNNANNKNSAYGILMFKIWLLDVILKKDSSL